MGDFVGQQVICHIFEHQRYPLFFVVGRHHQGQSRLRLFIGPLMVLFHHIFVALLSGDGDRLVLSGVKVFLPVFVGLNQPEQHDDETNCDGNGDNIYHNITI
jgi:hypothetical protein